MKFRHECKHRINPADIYALRARLNAVAERDPHSDADGSYIVKSLYFDTYADAVLREKLDGVNNREKFRIRYYGSDTSFIRLEKKSKINGLCSKVSCEISAEECRKITDGDFDFLLEGRHALMRELYTKTKHGLLRAKCIVAYTRESFVMPQGNVRVTIDTDIRAGYCVKDFLSPDLQLAKVCGQSVLEVKWDEYLPSIIRDCVQLRSRKTSSFSKYAAARFY